LQANAESVSIQVTASDDPRHPIELLVVDDGRGMDEATLASSLTFGGSSQFDDRSSLGRYGMGLPNGALSCARSVEVFTWRRRGPVLASRLDLDELVHSRRRHLPPVERIARPAFLPRTHHGTAVLLRRCDRVDYRRPLTLANKLRDELGRIYRRFLDDGLNLQVNDECVVAIDPLFLMRRGNRPGARRFGDKLTYQLQGVGAAGLVEVVFAELPVDRWHDLPSDEKRELGITNAPSVSIMRAGREIDRGWYFMGAKRRENYDDWWRCEVHFEPALDELFGITHAKQGISPRRDLLAVLEADLEPIARALNGRVRQRFELAKATKPLGDAERQAARAERSLPPLPRRSDSVSQSVRELLAKRPRHESNASPYQIVVGELPTTAAFEVVSQQGQLVLVFNARHPLYRDLYGPLAMSDLERDQDVAKRVALAVLAAARAEATSTRRGHRDEVRRFRQAWADVLATFFTA
jgi:hypothetical protein